MDISGLPTDLQDAARVEANGEVSWPEEKAADAVETLTAAGHRVVGLDIRFYFSDDTFHEIAWCDWDADPSAARAAALNALSRIDDLAWPTDAVERRILVTWD
jgi:CHASE2 domain-containing sensor protein